MILKILFGDDVKLNKSFWIVPQVISGSYKRFNHTSQSDEVRPFQLMKRFLFY